MNSIKQYINKGSVYMRYFLVFSIVFFIFSCRSTKHVPEGEYLLNKAKVECDNRDVDKEELESYLKQWPNRKILGFMRFHLWINNLVNPEREVKREVRRAKKQQQIDERRKRKGRKPKDRVFFTEWLLKIGEKPVIYDSTLQEKTVNQFRQYLKNKGYYNAEISDTVRYRRKKAFANYKITANNPYRIRSVDYKIDDYDLSLIVEKDSLSTLLRKNVIFDVDLLQKERLRITRLLNNLGYYYFSKEYIYFEVDSALKSNQADILIRIKRMVDQNLNERDHRKYKINNIYVYTDYDPRKALQNPEEYFSGFDTIEYKGVYFLHEKKFAVKPGVLLAASYIKSGNYYNLVDVEKTYKHLSSLRNFRLVNIVFKEPEDESGLKFELDCHIQLTPTTRQSYTFEIEGKNSSGRFGIEGNLNYQHKSLFKGAEIFDFKVKGSLESEPRAVEVTEKGEVVPFNTKEYGTEARIHFPKFLLPLKSERFVKRYNPKTTISTGYNHQKRPDYTRTIANAAFGYYWEGSKYITNIINPFEINSVKIYSISEDFSNRIRGRYIEHSYEDFFISETNYSFIFNNQDIKKRRDFTYFRANFETAGNLMTVYNNLIDKTKYDGSYQMFGTKYAQYIKADFDFRYYNIVNPTNKIVYRIFTGVGYPYGNQDAIPFVKQYFSGGANGIRAWQVRSLGPGSYKDDSRFFNQTADIKLEANLEYRFRLLKILEGALFLDAGNIWSILPEDDRSGAYFDINRFYNEIALGTGFGTRFDFTFFIFRLDLGIKVVDPQEDLGSRWILGTRKYTRNDFTLNIGIGYPF